VPLRFEELVVAVSQERRYGTGEGSSEVQRNLRLRHTVFRRLVDDPVLYFDDLSADERGYLSSPTGRQMLRKAAAEAGFVAEERAEGVLFVDPDEIATDSRFPDDAGHARVAALLLLDGMGLDGMGRATTVEQLEVAAARLLDRFPRWGQRYRAEGGAAHLTADALAVLTDFGLVRVAGGLVQPLPAAARYAVTGTRTAGDSAGELA
jgi:uncharacterized protein (TIGR02678 family)